MAQQTDLIEVAYDALERCAWLEARAGFEAALGELDSPEALEGLGRACWWLDDEPAILEARERAYRLYRERGDARGAARLALRLAKDAMVTHAEEAVANGWTERARRLLADVEPCPEHALLAAGDAYSAFLLSGDTETARRCAADAIAGARRFGVLDVEMLALAIEGASLVAEGDLVEGMRRLDEAMLAATGGEMRDLEVVGQTCCVTIRGYARVGDFDRAAQWCRRAQAYCQEFGLDSLLAVCRTQFAMVLIVRGDWSAAEVELLESCEQLAVRPGAAGEAVARLGELRRRQGRLDEAALLFERAAGMSQPRQAERHPLPLGDFGEILEARVSDRAERTAEHVLSRATCAGGPTR